MANQVLSQFTLRKEPFSEGLRIPQDQKIDPRMNCEKSTLMSCGKEATTVHVPFSIQCGDAKLKVKAERLFQILYEKKHFGSGKAICSLILDAFARLATCSSPVRVNIVYLKENKDGNKPGCYVSKERVIMIDKRALSELEFEDEKQLLDVLGTLLHEMTHALHYNLFASAKDASHENLEKELGCTKKLYESALTQASKCIPGMEWSYYHPQQDLVDQMRCYHFRPPAHYVRQAEWEIGFAEFLARFPQMFCHYGKDFSLEEMESAMHKIFPVGFQFFKENFQKRCRELARTNSCGFEQSRLTALQIKAEQLVHRLIGNIESYNGVEREYLRRFSEIVLTNDRSRCLKTRVYLEGVDLRGESQISRKEIEECLKRGIYHRSMTPGNELMFQASVVEAFANAEEAAWKEQSVLLMREIRSIVLKDMEQEKLRKRNPPIVGQNLTTIERSSAKRLFEMLSLQYLDNSTSASNSKTLETFIKLTHEFGEGHVQVEIVKSKPGHLNGKGCHFITCPSPDLGLSRVKKLMISAQFLEEFEKLREENNPALKKRLHQVMQEIELTLDSA